ncbi:MAG: hypothetical protein ACREN1_10245 [Candidatus Dormibacteria bacterium]
MAVPLKYQSLYLGLDGGGLSQPALMARTSYAAIEKYFPEPQSASPTPRANAQGGQLYVGLTLGRLTCRNYYLARARYGPGLVVTLTVRQRRLPPRMACFELIGPVRYQLLALPLGQFPGHARLTVVVQRPPGASGEQVRRHLP